MATEGDGQGLDMQAQTGGRVSLVCRDLGWETRDGVGRAQAWRGVSRLKAVGTLPRTPSSDLKPPAPATGSWGSPTTRARARTA